MNLFRQSKTLLSVEKQTPIEAKLIDGTITKPAQAKPMEEKTEIKTFEIDRTCPTCGKGKMRPFGDMGYANQHEHYCNNPGCGAKELIVGKRYPYLITERGVAQVID